LLAPGTNPTIAYGRNAAAAWALAAARAAPRIIDDGAQTRLLRRPAPRNDRHLQCHCERSEAIRCLAGAFAPLPPLLARLHRDLKRSFDPAGIFNPGRLYPEF